MKITDLISIVGGVAKGFVPGVAEFEEAAKAVINLAKDIRPTLASTDQAALDAALPGLLSKMNVDVDAAIAALRGTG
jgi:hypothetical protein